MAKGDVTATEKQQESQEYQKKSMLVVRGEVGSRNLKSYTFLSRCCSVVGESSARFCRGKGGLSKSNGHIITLEGNWSSLLLSMASGK